MKPVEHMEQNGESAKVSGKSIRIRSFNLLNAASRGRALMEIDEIFYEASNVQSFDDDQHRTSFRWLWLGRYLAEEPEHALVALRGDESVCGYLVGSLRDPAPRPEFAELSYFADFAAETARFPAHLHINVAADMRGQGIGELLVCAFAAHAIGTATKGMHVVTGEGMRNVRFYERLGFREVARAKRSGSHVVMLAKALQQGTATGHFTKHMSRAAKP